MVMEYIEHDLKGIMETMKQPFSQNIKFALNNQGDMKICDFGLAHQYRSPLKPYTHLVVTLWYRHLSFCWGKKNIQRLLICGHSIALWLSFYQRSLSLMENQSLISLTRILGTPNETIWPGFSKLPGVKVNFVKHQLPALGDSGLAFWPHWYTSSYKGTYRITADAALKHGWFCEVPLPKSKEFMPTFPAQLVEGKTQEAPRFKVAAYLLQNARKLCRGIKLQFWTMHRAGEDEATEKTRTFQTLE
ncbi:Cyclin-dependent kinase G-2 [Bienertia sinuspersici]